MQSSQYTQEESAEEGLYLFVGVLLAQRNFELGFRFRILVFRFEADDDSVQEEVVESNRSSVHHLLVEILQSMNASGQFRESNRE